MLKAVIKKSMKYLKTITLCFLLLLGLYFLTGEPLASAHGDIDRSEPEAGAVLPAAPAEVHIWFSQELFRREGANVIEVSGPEGARVDRGDTRLDDDDRTHAFVSLQPELPPGLYTVNWRNLSVEDGHEGSGEFSFTVEAASGEAMPQSSPSEAQQPVAETPVSPTPAPVSTPPASGGLPCLAGFLLGGVFLGGVAFDRYRSRKD